MTRCVVETKISSGLVSAFVFSWKPGPAHTGPPSKLISDVDHERVGNVASIEPCSVSCDEREKTYNPLSDSGPEGR
jgi:hypothetical protein